MLPSQFTKKLLSNTQIGSSSSFVKVIQNSINIGNKSSPMHAEELTSNDRLNHVGIQKDNNNGNRFKDAGKVVSNGIFSESFKKQITDLMEDNQMAPKIEIDNTFIPGKSSILEECRKRKIGISKDLKTTAGVLTSECTKKQKETGEEERIFDSDYGLTNLYSIDETHANNDNQKQKRKSKGKTVKNSSNKNQAGNKSRPNHFLSVRVKDKSLHSKVKNIHSHITSSNKMMQHCFVPSSTLHVTLFVMNLPDTVSKQKAIDAMSLCTNKISNIVRNCSDMNLRFKNLNSFGSGQVVFIDLMQNEGLVLLRSIVAALKSAFAELNIEFNNDDKFVPHLTIMKMSKCYKVMKKAGIRRIAPHLYEKYTNDLFGAQEINEIQLCSMTDKKEGDGFYKVLASMKLEDPVDIEIPCKKEKDGFDNVDLSSYEVLPRWKEMIDDFEIDASWDEITDQESKEVNATLTPDTNTVKEPS